MIFEAELTYAGYEKRKSSVIFYFNSSDKKQYKMTVKEMNHILPRLNEGKIKSTWIIRKKGTRSRIYEANGYRTRDTYNIKH